MNSVYLRYTHEDDDLDIHTERNPKTGIECRFSSKSRGMEPRKTSEDKTGPFRNRLIDANDHGRVASV